jgi:hypothetical protein
MISFAWTEVRQKAELGSIANLMLRDSSLLLQKRVCTITPDDLFSVVYSYDIDADTEHVITQQYPRLLTLWTPNLQP